MFQQAHNPMEMQYIYNYSSESCIVHGFFVNVCLANPHSIFRTSNMFHQLLKQ